MKHYHEDWIQEWCEDNGWSDLFVERYNNYWAFPPGAVMPEPIPQKILTLIKAEKGFTLEERNWLLAIVITSIFGGILTYIWQCPLPIVISFAFSAITVARMEVE
jgi:hypothetical protein